MSCNNSKCIHAYHSPTGDKIEAEHKLRKVTTKFKVKEREIAMLQEKLQLLHDRLKVQIGGKVSNGNGSAESKDSQHTPLEQQMMAELALTETNMLNMKTKLEEYEDKLATINEELNLERNRRREVESHFMGSLNNRSVVDGVTNRILMQHRNSILYGDSMHRANVRPISRFMN